MKYVWPYIMTSKQIELWVDSLLCEKEQILAPVETTHGKFSFERLIDAKKLRLDYSTTLIPPTQKIFMPLNEPVISWTKVDGKTVFSGGAKSEKPLIVFGMHPYDIHALKAWDETMGQKRGTLADPDYVAKRKNTIIIGMDVITPPPHSFCGSMGTHTVKDGYDIMITFIGDDKYFVEVVSATGLYILFSAPEYSDAKNADYKLRTKIRKEVLEKYPRTLPIKRERIKSFLEKRIDHPYFDKTGELCVACAKCTFVCPTCTCCNIKEEPALDGKSGCRVRECDSCQLAGFTKMAGGVISRKTPGARIRHRILDKFDYNHGMIASCVGCGRCVDVCPAGIADPVKALIALKEEDFSHE